MRDRMILFRGLFDLDECFRCIISDSTFHGGDPADPSNWQLPCEFFQKFWFLTTDYTLQRITNKWRKIQGLQSLPLNALSEIHHSSPSSTFTESHQEQSSYAESLTSDDTTSTRQHAPPDSNDLFSASPIQLTAGNIPTHRSHQAHQNSTTNAMNLALDDWETVLSTTFQNQYQGKVPFTWLHDICLLTEFLDILMGDHTANTATESV